MASTQPATQLPIAHVLPLLGLVQLDRGFDYYVPEDDSDHCQPGVRVRIRFSGRLTDAIVLERREASDFTGRIAFIERVISPDVVAPQPLRELVATLATYYAGTQADIYRLAIPTRHASTETSIHKRLEDKPLADEATTLKAEPDLTEWEKYRHQESFRTAIVQRRRPWAIWGAAPGEDRLARLAELCADVLSRGDHRILVLVPTAKQVARFTELIQQYVPHDLVADVTSQQGNSARYRRFLLALHGLCRIVVGTRGAAFSPIDFTFAIMLDDGDDMFIEPRAPYTHARDVMLQRAQSLGASVLIGGFSRSTESAQLVAQGLAHDLVADRETLRQRRPRIHAVGDSDYELERDPRARYDRLPKAVFTAIRQALDADRPVLVHSPRAGYIPSLSCQKCRTPIRCRWCNGPCSLRKTPSGEAVECRWCGRGQPGHRCTECGCTRLRASVVGSQRTAEELGRAFAGVPVTISAEDHIVDEVPPGRRIVVATPGAMPRGRYGAAILLDCWAELGREDLRAYERTLTTWMGIAAQVYPASDGGEVVVIAESTHPTVQALIRWDPIGDSSLTLVERTEANLPPSTPLAVVDAAAKDLTEFRRRLELPEHADVLGPTPLPSWIRPPAGATGPIMRLIIRYRDPDPTAATALLDPTLGRALGDVRRRAALERVDLTVRIIVDPVHIG